MRKIAVEMMQLNQQMVGLISPEKLHNLKNQAQQQPNPNAEKYGRRMIWLN